MTHDANRDLDRLFGGEYGESPIRFQTRCTHGGRACPKIIQAIPLQSVQDAHRRPSCLPSLLVAALIVGMAILSELVPTVAGAIAAVLP